MQEVIQVRLRETGNILYYYTNNIRPKTGDYVIVEVDRGHDYAQVIGGPVLRTDLSGPLKVMVTIFGRATPVELEFLQVEKP